MRWIHNNLSVINLIKKINHQNYFKRLLFMLFGMFIGAICFNLFFSPYDIVTGGTSGLALIARKLFGIDISIFISISSFVLLIISYIFLGYEKTINAVMGLIFYPLFVNLTANVSSLIDLNVGNMILIPIFGGLLDGVSSGIVYKNGFSFGGIQIINQMVSKYAKISLGKSSLIVNSIIIIGASFTFGIVKSLYAVMALYVGSKVVDRIILGISNNKAFYIITEKESEIKEFILKELSHSVTTIKARGGYTDDKKKVLMCVIPTSEYFLVKQVVLEIDKDAFFLITDSYEVVGAQ